MRKISYGSSNPKSFNAYPRGGDFDLESGGTLKRIRKPKNPPIYLVRMFKSIGNRIHYYYKLHPVIVLFICLSIGVTLLMILSMYENHYRMTNYYGKLNLNSERFPFPKLRNLVMVAGHSVYASSSCEKVEKEDSWVLESYQKHPGQAATFVSHIKEGIEIAAMDDAALLLFSGGETRKNAGPRSEAQSYWAVAESKSWFGNAFLKSRMDCNMIVIHDYLINCCNV